MNMTPHTSQMRRTPSRPFLAARAAALLAFVALLTSGLTFAQHADLVPQPRELQNTGAPFRVHSATRIVLTGAAPTERFAAISLQDELKSVTASTVPIISGHGSAAHAIVLGLIENPAIHQLLLGRHLPTAALPSEGYVLDVRENDILVAGKDPSGLFYAIQTLRQLVSATHGHAEIPGVRIRDWPALAYRGTQVDLSRGPVPKLAYLKRIVRTIAEFKMNQLTLYMEDAFPLAGQPLVGALDDSLSRSDFQQLVAYAAPFHVEIIPATEGCGHLHKVLRFEQYSTMAEVPRGNDLIADDPAANQFLDQFYSQINSTFPASLYNIGCDETAELGTGRSSARVQQDGYAAVYAQSVTRAYNLLSRYHKQAIFWGDMAVAHPDVVSKLPKDLIAATWEYFPQSSYEPWIKPFTNAGMKLIVCPWVGNTSLIVPDYDVAASNIADFIDAGKKAGALGVNVTVWNDDGETLFAPNWWSIVYGAANAWEENKTPVAAFDSKFDWVFFRSNGYRFTEQIKKLANLNELLHRQGIFYVYSSDFGGTNDSLFWRDPFSPSGWADTQKIAPAAPALRRIAEDAFSLLSGNENFALRNADTLKYFEFAALKLDALGMRYEYLPEIAQRYSRILANEKTSTAAETDSALFQIQGVNGPLFDLRDYTTRLRALYQDLWLSENLGSWLPNILQLYDRNSQLWQQHIAQFDQLKWDHRQGRPLPPLDSFELPSPTPH
jgi:hexosaminidase